MHSHDLKQSRSEARLISHTGELLHVPSPQAQAPKEGFHDADPSVTSQGLKQAPVVDSGISV
jgi:hypothetical protein